MIYNCERRPLIFKQSMFLQSVHESVGENYVDLIFFTRTTLMKIQSSKKTYKTLSPTPEDPERRATHHVTLVCRRQSPLLRAIPAKTSRMLSRLRMTRSLATAISKPAAPSDAECEARAGPSPQQAGSRKPLFRGTTDRPLHRPIPLIWPCFGGANRLRRGALFPPPSNH